MPQAKFPDMGYSDSDPRPQQPVDLRPPAPSQSAQDNSSNNDK